MKMCRNIVLAVMFTLLTVVSCGREDALEDSNVSAKLKPGKSQSTVNSSSGSGKGVHDDNRNGKRVPYIVIDRYCNRLFLRTADSILLDADCSTGSGGELFDNATGRRWKFDTPSGVFTVSSKQKNPWWRKPDWAFIEEGEPPPKSNSDRLDANMMGDYAIGFGDGFFIHGTIYERLIGVAVTHGCVRMEAADLKKLYEKATIGTRVYVY
ncbi:MAG: L,D-transpeptidase [candidate division Zixibacteria bacterium]|nr:L,D-transpeptidase [candidate division Zixibacteria bacterium]MBU1470848.1 L,D-transpeptidase [candidate division Zixibacteria bacterium]MBU2625732.1 L,D-transpeptidase [candidate division Zixibacteria bacterium]